MSNQPIGQMTDTLNRIFMGPNCGGWSVLWRRIFLLTLPISLPLWLAFDVLVVLAVLLTPAARWVKETWGSND